MAEEVAAHYAEGAGAGADLADMIWRRMTRAGVDMGALTTKSLAPVDDFHIGGREATREILTHLPLGPAARLLDIGSGLGGPARLAAETLGCHVLGVDLTPEFVAAAETLSGWVGLHDRVAFQQGDATALPVASAAFDAAMSLHVGMNVSAKDRFYAEARRALRPGGRFAIYDVLAGPGGPPHLPVPWARKSEHSHLETEAGLLTLLRAAGFEALEAIDRTADSLAWFERGPERIRRDGPPPVSVRDLLGEDADAMMGAVLRNLREGRIRTVLLLADAPS